MQRLRPLHSRHSNRAARYAMLYAVIVLSFLAGFLTPLTTPAFAAQHEATQEADAAQVASDGADAPEGTVVGDSDGAGAPSAQATAEEETAGDPDGDQSGGQTDGSEQPRARSRRAIEEAQDTANLTMTIANDADRVKVRDTQITTVNFACSSVNVPCRGGVITVDIPAPTTPDGQVLTTRMAASVVSGNNVQRLVPSYPFAGSGLYRLTFYMKEPLAAGTSDRLQINWWYPNNDAPDGSTVDVTASFSANNAESVDARATTTLTASSDVAIEKKKLGAPPAFGSTASYQLRYGYQQIDNTDSNYVGIRWNGSAYNGNQNGIGFVELQNIKVVDPLPDGAEFVSATGGGVYDSATRTVTWSYDSWSWQNPIQNTVVLRYPQGSYDISDQVTNTATITAEQKNNPAVTYSKSSQATHGFAPSNPRGNISKQGDDYNGAFRKGTYQWRFAVNNSGNTTLHQVWDDTLPCTWSTQDAAAGNCDKPSLVGPYDFYIFRPNGSEDGWNWEYWTNTGEHVVLNNQTETKRVELPEGQYITRIRIESDIAPGNGATVWFRGHVPEDFPREEPSDFDSRYNPASKPESYFNYVKSDEYVRVQNCASATLTDVASGRVLASNDNLCSWNRVKTNFPSLHPSVDAPRGLVKSGDRLPLTLSVSIRNPEDNGLAAPFVVTDLLPLGVDMDEIPDSAFRETALKNPDGSPYDVSQIKREIIKDYEGTGRTLIRLTVPTPSYNLLRVILETKTDSRLSAGKVENRVQAKFIDSEVEPYTRTSSFRLREYCPRAVVAQDTLDLNGSGGTTDYMCETPSSFVVAVSPGMTIEKEVRGNRDADFVSSPKIAQIDPGSDGAYRFTISNTGNVALKHAVAYDLLPHLGDTGVGPAASQERGSKWKPQINSTQWTFESVTETPGQEATVSAVPASDITVQYTTALNPCRGEVLSAGGAMNQAPAGCTPNAWGDAPANLADITGFRLVMNRDIAPGEKIRFVAPITSPADANYTAWNSAALSGGYDQNGKTLYLLPSEAPKVGIEVVTDLALSKDAVKAVVDSGQPVLDGDGLPQAATPRQLLSAGDYVLYRISVVNNGPAAASGITVSDALPEGVEYVASYTRLCPPGGDQQPVVPCAGTVENGNYDPASSTWQVMPSEQAGTNLPVWASSTLYILAKISDTTKGRTITNRAEIGQYDQIDRDPSNNEASADISVGGTISGLVYNDADADWTRADDGEPPFEGVTLTLLDSNGQPVLDGSGAEVTTTTDAHGAYSFPGLPMGTYSVRITRGTATVDGAQVSMDDYTATYAWGRSPDRSYAGVDSSTTSPIALTQQSPDASNVDFGFTKPAKIGNRVWFDANKNGLQDEGERGVPHVGVYVMYSDDLGALDASGNPVQQVFTDENGEYHFDNLLPTPKNSDVQYRLLFFLPEGYSATSSQVGEDRAIDSNGDNSLFSLKQGQVDDTFDLGLVADGRVEGTLIWDINNQGGAVPTSVDRPLAGVTVTLTRRDGGTDTTIETQTDADGHYSFKDLAPGDYTVTVDRDSLARICPECTAQTHAPSGDMVASVGQQLSLTSKVSLVPTHMMVGSQDFAFTGPANTSVEKAITSPAAEPDGGFEPGAEVTYTLTMTNRGPSPVTGWSANDPLPAGVEFVRSAGDGTYSADTGVWDLSDQVIDKDATRSVTITVRVTPEAAGRVVTNTVTVARQDQIGDDASDNTASADLSAGYVLSGKVYNDADASFSAGNNETPYAGVRLTLTHPDGTPVLGSDSQPVTAETKADGTYAFTRLPLGDYRVSIVDPDGGPLQGTKPTEAYNSRYNNTADVSIAKATGSVVDVNFGRVKPASIGDTTWIDVNRDGVQGADEPKLTGVRVRLTDVNGGPVTDADGHDVADAVTDEQGHYTFENLLPGTYKVSFQAPAGYTPTQVSAGSDPKADSNGDNADVTLEQGSSEDTIDFGAVGTGVVGDRIFVDVNHSGGAEPDQGDRPLAGVTVKLTWRGPEGATATYEAVTDAQGSYGFSDLLPGDYTIEVDRDSLTKAEALLNVQTRAPGGDTDRTPGNEWTLTNEFTLTGDHMTRTDQDWAFAISADTSIAKAITSPSADEQEDFQFTPGKQISYTLTVTNNGPGPATGVTASDPLPAGVSFVSATGDGTFDQASGAWDLSDQVIASGESRTLVITVRIESDSAGTLVSNIAQITHQDQSGDDTTNNRASADFKGGYNLGGLVYRDSDGSYTKGEQETPFAGVTVALLGADGQPVNGQDGQPLTATTDQDGRYQFVGIAPGTYRVSVVGTDSGDLAGLVPTQAYKGRGQINDKTVVAQVSVSAETGSVEGVDFGFVSPASVGDRVWIDANRNGTQDPGEDSLSGVVVILSDGSGTEIARQTSDANGSYRFDGLLPGTYTVAIEVPTGYEAVATTTLEVTLSEGEVKDDVDFPLAPIVIPSNPILPSAAGALARTGADTVVGWAALLAMAGVTAVHARRRRK